MQCWKEREHSLDWSVRTTAPPHASEEGEEHKVKEAREREKQEEEEERVGVIQLPLPEKRVISLNETE